MSLASSALHCATLEEGQYWQSSPFPLQCIQTHTFLFHWNAITSPWKGWISAKALSSIGVYPSHHFPNFPQLQLTGAVDSVQTPAGSAVSTGVCLPLPNAQEGEPPPRSVVLGPTTTWRDFCSWMGTELVDKEGQKEERLIEP